MADRRSAWTREYSAKLFPNGPDRVIADHTALLETLFAFDDVLDGVSIELDYPRLRSFAMDFGHIWYPTTKRTRFPAELDELLDAGRDCRDRLVGYPGADRLLAYLDSHWRAGAAAMLQEARWRLGVQPMPDLTGYLRNAITSLFGQAVHAALLLMTGEAALDAPDLDRWQWAGYLSCLVIRLHNDMAGAEREQYEKGPTLYRFFPDVDPDALVRMVQVATGTVLPLFDHALGVLPPSVARAGQLLRRSTTIACQQYAAEVTL